MATERELLELAAVAAGISGQSYWGENPIHRGIYTGGRYWNPLTDDGDALRLAVELKIEIEHNHPGDQDAWVSTWHRPTSHEEVEAIDDETMRLAATRRAIVRAAAEIGRNMP